MTEHFDLGQFGLDFCFDDESYTRVSRGAAHLMAGIALLGWDEDDALREVALLLAGEDENEVVRYGALLACGFVRFSGMEAMHEAVGGNESFGGMMIFDGDGNRVEPGHVEDPGLAVAVTATQVCTALVTRDVDMVRALLLGTPDKVGLVYVLSRTAAGVMMSQG